ncbi:MAG: hypothetical protein K6347_00875 [Campylobacterales bacterium]
MRLSRIWNLLGRFGQGRGFSGVVIIDSSTRLAWFIDNGIFRPLDRNLASKDYFITSLLLPKSVIYGSLSINESEVGDDLSEFIELKAYEEMGLDQSLDYLIVPYEKSPQTGVSSADATLYEIYVTEREALKRLYRELLGQWPFIDLLIFPPHLYAFLYYREIIRPKGAHIFVHLGREDLFVTIYENGAYRYSKSLKLNLTLMHERYCDAIGEKITFDDFLQLLACNEEERQSRDPLGALTRVLSELFLALSDVLVHAKRLYMIDLYEALYFDSEIGQIDGIDYFSQNYLGVSIATIPAPFPSHETAGFVVEPTHRPPLIIMLAAMAASETIAGEIGVQIPNFTIFPRPPALYQRDGGRLILSIAASLLLVVGYPGVLWLHDQLILKKELASLERRDRQLADEVAAFEAKISQRQDQHHQIEQQIAAEEALFKERELLITKVHEMSSSYIPKAATLTDFFTFFSRFGAKLEILSFTQESIIFYLYTKEAGKMTGLIRQFVLSHPDYKIKTDGLVFDLNTSLYKSTVTVRIR